MSVPWTYNVPEHLFLDEKGRVKDGMSLIGYYRRLAKHGIIGEPWASCIKPMTFGALYGGQVSILSVL